MFREQYNQLNKQVIPEKTLVEHTIAQAIKLHSKSNAPNVLWGKTAVALVCSCLCLLLAMPVLAATVEPLYQLMYMLSPSVAQFFMPVRESDEDNGIKMEIVSAYIHGDTAEIYLSLEDLTGNRIDETTDLFDSYAINRPFDSSAHCELVGYDENTKKATFLIILEQWGDKDIAGEKITFTLTQFISNQTKYEDIPIAIDLSEIVTAEKTQIATNVRGGGGSDYEKHVGTRDPIALLPTQPMDGFAVDGIDLTGIGYIDDMLHIQTAVKDNLDKDNHGYFYLKDGDGNKISSNYNFGFVNQYDQPGRIDYNDDVFDIGQNEIENYTLHGNFWVTGDCTRGNWSVTFPLEQSK